MRILVAPDKFKGSLGARAVAENIALGLREALPDAEITLLPVADGGEGTAAAICAAAHGDWQTCRVHDPLGRVVDARYGTLPGGATAVMEMSEASGLWRLSPNECNPVRASSFGTGQMILETARRGAREIIIGLGGSATNDGGFGLARALGYRFLNPDGEDLTGNVTDLLCLARICPPPGLELPKITAACDVRNPLLGARGATRVFAAQKGATPAQIETLEMALTRLADVASASSGQRRRDVPGAGAAGGLGYGLIAFCGAELRPGFELVAEQIGLEEAVQAADVVITGEGRLDAQTAEGKAPAGVAQMARRLGKKCYAIVGEMEDAPELRGLFDRIVVLGGPIADTARLLREQARSLL